MSDYIFAHDTIRPEQKRLADAVYEAMKSGKTILAHAPTGLGKTAAILSPAVTYARHHKKTIVFLTSRYTQHQIVLKTLRQLQEKQDVPITVCDLIAKKWMCAVPGANMLAPGEFLTYCRKQREANLCDFYSQTKKQNQVLTPDARLKLDQLSGRVLDVQTLKSECETAHLCPYEMALELGKDATVIIADYNYIFHPRIQEAFLKKISKQLKNCIVVVDEGHNLPDRAKDMASLKLSLRQADLAIGEAQKFGQFEVVQIIKEVKRLLEEFRDVAAQEQPVNKEWFIDGISEFMDYNEAIEHLVAATDAVYQKQQRSFISNVHDFFIAWNGDSKGFTRIISKDADSIVLSYRCLDPRLQTKVVFEEAHSTIIMSGTLQPLTFYRDVLGVASVPHEMMVFNSPFDKENALHLIVPKTSTKYQDRNDEQYKAIAQECSNVADAIPGNVAIFFPSYNILKNVNFHFMSMCSKTTFVEHSDLSKDDRTQLLHKFGEYKNSGAVLLGVASGSFGEGIDLPGDLLKGVIIVGLPLPKPDLETNQLIKYYDLLFHKGWDYGYVYPAFNKTLQNAGRCIRTDKDRGVIVYLDKRYTWPQYKQCFPSNLEIRSSMEPVPMIRDFFLNES
ncbi:MAG: DNA excision repair protein ERCC-2 [Candidatus Woesearchaeota archaeon]|jgi:DNA excision repair protein ERCC-2